MQIARESPRNCYYRSLIIVIIRIYVHTHVRTLLFIIISVIICYYLLRFTIYCLEFSLKRLLGIDLLFSRKERDFYFL